LTPPPIPTFLPYTTLFRSQTAFAGNREARRHLHGGGAHFQEAGRIAAGEYTAGGNHRNIEFLGLDEVEHLAGDGRQVVFTPVVQDRKSTRLNSSHVKISYA